MNYKTKLGHITTFIFDIDGVLTDGKVAIFKDGEWVRSMNIKDGYALQHAVKQGFKVAVISGGTNESIGQRLKTLGVADVFLGVRDKLDVYHTFLIDYGLRSEEIAYMGDDLPDYEVLQTVGLSTCPSCSRNTRNGRLCIAIQGRQWLFARSDRTSASHAGKVVYSP